ncbi:GDYXXLXY domain-containing protein [Bacillus timonensis]|nr:GDYXXLXY domain-containing protein [Bacillus timonensis]
MKKMIPLGYLGSITLLLSGIIYFFAANWPEYSRFEKLGLSVGAMLLFYLVAFMSKKLLAHQTFLSKWFIVAGAFSFGLTTALIGQIYNSHADSYLLFIIWLIPTVLLALITRYAPLWVLSYVLLHLSYWFYMNPSSYQVSRTDLQEYLIFVVIIAINLMLFLLTFTTNFPIRIIRYLSFTVANFTLIGISFAELYPPYSGWTNVLFIALAILCYRYIAMKQVDKIVTVLLFISGCMYVYAKVVELPFLIGNTFGFIALQLSGSFISLSLLIGGIYLARRVLKHASGDWTQFLKKVLIASVTLIGSGMFASSFGSILFFVTGSEYAAVFLSLLFISVGVFLNKLDPVARQTLLLIGFFSGLAESIFLNLFVTFLFLSISIIVTGMVKDGVVRFFSYTTAIGCLLSLIFQHLDVDFDNQLEMVFILFALVNSCLAYFLQKLKDLFRISIFFSLAFAFALTFVNQTTWVDILYTCLFFILSSGLIIFFHRIDDRFSFRLTVVFWFAFLIATYYDFVWSLVHKSLSLLIIGLILFVVTHFISNKFDHTTEIKSAFTQKQWLLIAGVILLQLAFSSYQVSSNEYLIKNGKEIKLELAPVDPRSLLQGDYVILRYEIGQIELKDTHSSHPVYLLLKKDNDGIYRTLKVYTNKENALDVKLESDEAIIAGTYNGYDNIVFGIESYFVKEGTGLDLQREAKYATVIVNKKGDAILIKVE